MRGVYAVLGSEPVARRAALDRLRTQAGEWQELKAGQHEPEQILTPSLLADPDHPSVRVISDYTAWSPAQRKRAARLLEEPAPGVCLVVVAPKLGAKDPLRTALVCDDQIISAETPAEGRFPNWVQAHAQALGARCDSTAAQRLVELVGENTQSLGTEIDKLVRCTNGEMIDADLVSRLVWPAKRDHSAWAWCDAIMHRDLGKALQELELLEQADGAPLALTGLLLGRLSTTAWAALGAQAASVGVKPYPWRIAQDAVRAGWDAPRLAWALELAAEADAGLRGGSALDPWATLSALCVQLTGRPAQAASPVL